MDENHIPTAVDRVKCSRHKAEHGQPCWWIWPLSGRRKTPAICNQRALNAGFVGEIDPRSLRKR